MNQHLNPSGFDADAAVNDCLDLESSGRPDELRDLIVRCKAIDPDFESKLNAARASLSELRQTPWSPNMTTEILGEVDYLRPFLTPRRRKHVSSTRVAIAAAAVITLSIVGIMQKLGPSPGPLNSAAPGGAMTASGTNPAEAVRSIADTVNDLRQDPVGKPAPVGRPHRWPGARSESSDLAMGDTSTYDGALNWSRELSLSPAASADLLLGLRSAEESLTVASTGITPGRPVLSLAPGTGLLEQPRGISVFSRLDPNTSLVDLKSDAALGPPRHRTVQWIKLVPAKKGK